jgi:hypothetical protein
VEGLQTDTEKFDEEYEQKLGLCFYTYLLISKRLPALLSVCFSRQEIYESMVTHYDELVKQVNYQLSVRHLTTSTLVGQLGQF